jgi:uncharacterized membrane protein
MPDSIGKLLAICKAEEQQREDNASLLTGPVVDQAALHSVLRKVRDVGLPLISVNRVKPV